ILMDGSTQCAAKLILSIEAARWREEIAGIERSIPQELKAAPVQLVGAAPRDNVDDTAAIVPVLGVEIIGQDAELGNRIETRYDRGAAVHQFLDVASIYHEAVGVFALTADGLVAG